MPHAKTNDVRLVLITAPNETTAGEIAEALVAQRLAACINLVPGLNSIYRWRGKIQHDRECLLLVKTRASAVNLVVETTRKLHPYRLPEIIAIEVSGGLKTYLSWVKRSVKPANSQNIQPESPIKATPTKRK